MTGWWKLDGVKNIYELSPVNNQKSFYGKAKIFQTVDGSVYLQSYNTLVCKIEPDGTFTRLWDGYSATTAKHIDSFRVMNGLPKISKKEWTNLDCYPVK